MCVRVRVCVVGEGGGGGGRGGGGEGWEGYYIYLEFHIPEKTPRR